MHLHDDLNVFEIYEQDNLNRNNSYSKSNLNRFYHLDFFELLNHNVKCIIHLPLLKEKMLLLIFQIS
jgi:hypothetical protein